jgi:hypothetical protein
MQGGLHMGSFRKVAVFIGVVGLLFGVTSMADAAHTKSHAKTQAGAQSKADMENPTRLPGQGPGAPEMILQGPVLAVSPAAGFIVMRHGTGKDPEELPINIDSKTTVTRGGKTISLDEVKVGDRIRVSYTGQPGEVSKMVNILGGPSMRPGSSKASGTRRGTGM